MVGALRPRAEGSRPTRPGLLVEVAGVAGSGKSTLTEGLRAHLALPAAGYRLPLLRSLPRLARSAASSAALILEEPGRWLRDVRLLAHYEAMVADLCSPRRRRAAATLLDQGPLYIYVFAEWGGLPGPRRDRLRRRLERSLDAFAGVLDAVVWLDASDDALLARISGRGKDHLVKGRPRDEAVAFLAEFRAAYEAVLDRLATRHGVPVLRFDTGSEPASQVVRRVAAELERLGLTS